MKTILRNMRIKWIFLLMMFFYFVGLQALENTQTCRIVTFQFFNNNYLVVPNASSATARYSSSTTNNQWYEIPAGINAFGKQLYYYKNVATNKYLYCGSNQYGDNGDWYYNDALVSSTKLLTDSYKWALVTNPTQSTYTFIANSNGYTNQTTEAEIKDGSFRYIHNFIEFYPDLFPSITSPNALCGINKSDINGNVWCRGVRVTVINDAVVNPDYNGCFNIFRVNAMDYFSNNEYENITDEEKLATSSFRQDVFQSDGTYNAGYINSGEWASYIINPCITGTYKVTAKIASTSNGTRANTLRTGSNTGTTIGSLTNYKTGNLQTFSEISTTVNLTAGEQTIFFVSKNTISVWYMTFELQVPTVTGLSATKNNQCQVDLAWTAVSNATSYDIYRSTSYYGTYTLIGSATSNSYLDGEVNASTTYYYKLITKMGYSLSTYSSIVYAKTSVAALPSVISPNATDITHNSVTLGATITSGGIALTAKGTSYKTSSPVALSDNKLNDSDLNAGAFTQSRTGLSSQTRYYYLVYARNSKGTTLGSESSFRTLSAPATTQASGLSASFVNTTGTNVTGTVSLSLATGATFPTSGATKGGYLVIYSTGTPSLIASPNGLAPVNVVSSGTSYVQKNESSLSSVTPSNSLGNIAGLTVCTTYNFKVIPYTWDGVNPATYNYYTTGTIAGVTLGIESTAYNLTETPWSVGTKIEAENFDYGGLGCAFYESGNGSSNSYRTDAGTAVTLESGSGQSGYNIAYVAADEWLQYTVQVNVPGDYIITSRAATQYSNKTLRYFVDGIQVGNDIEVTQDDWQNYYDESSTSSVYLTAGVHKIKIYFVNGEVNLDWIKLEMASPVTGVSLNCSSFILLQGFTKTLVATVNPLNAKSKSVTWKSSNTSVATVDQHGVVTAISAGTATITVTTLEGGYKDTAVVTVLPTCTPLILRTVTPPPIDNSDVANSVWSNAPKKEIAKLVVGTATNSPAGSWSALYDNDSLYLLIEVLDNSPFHNNSTLHQGDGVEIYIDGDNNSSLTSYSGKQYLLRYNYVNSSSSSVQISGNTIAQALIDASNAIIYKTADGYNVKVALPWSEIKTNYLTNNGGLRMDVAVNQSDETWGTTTRKGQLNSFSTSNQLYVNPSLFTFVPFFEMTGVKDTVIPQNTNVQLSVSTSLTPEKITWVSDPMGNGGTGSTIMVNQNFDTKYIITAKLGCASISKEMQALLQVQVDTIVWTDLAKDGEWDNYNNWINYSSMKFINNRSKFAEDLTVIFPSPDTIEYYQNKYGLSPILGNPSTPIGRINSVGYPNGKIPQIIRMSDTKLMKKLKIEYGASLMITPLLNKCEEVEVSLEIADRNEWILVGPNIKPLDGGVTRSMMSGDFYLNQTPQVYMSEMTIDSTNITNWGKSFASLSETVSPNKCYAIRVPDQYGKYKVSGRYYYRKDSTVSATIGSDPVTFVFKGKFFNEQETPTICTKPSKFVISCNTFLANISAKKFLDKFGGQIAVWNFNEESNGMAQMGSFTAYNSTTVPTDLYIKPMQAFLYLDANGTNRTITLNEADVCDLSASTKYRAKTSVPEMPTLEIVASNGNYSSKTNIVYDEYLNDGSFDLSKDIVKLFSAYDNTPDIFSYLGNNHLQAQTINNLNNIVDLGIRIGNDDTLKLTITGGEQFEGVYLVDKQTNTTYDLSASDTTKIELDVLSGTNSDRLYVKFDPVVPEIITDVRNTEKESIKIYAENNKKVIVSNSVYTQIKEILIVDLLGHVIRINPTSDSYNVIDMSNYAAGVYTVKAVTEFGSKTEKIVIR